MRIGVCTTDFTVRPALELFQRVKELGFACVQFAFASVTETGFEPSGVYEIPFNVSADALDAIRAASAQTGVDIVAVNGTYNMAHPDAAMREEGIARFEGFAQAVVALGVQYISLCSGTRNSDHLWTHHPDNGTPEAWDDALDSLKRASAVAERLGLVLAIETEANNVIDTPEKARRMLDSVGSPALGMIMDCANLFHHGTAYRKNVDNTMMEAFAAYGRDVVLAHGKDICEGDGIQFCPTGQGIVNYPLFYSLLEEYKYQGDMLLHGIYDEALMPWCIERVAKPVAHCVI